MSVIITYFCPDVDAKVDELTLANHKEKLSAFIKAVNDVDQLFNSFAISHKGAPIFLNGGYGSIEIDPEGLKDLHQLVQTAKGNIAQDIAVGVGKDLKTAAIACIYCMNQKGSQKPVVYQPNMDQEIGPPDEEIVKAEDEAPPSGDTAEGDDQDIMNVIAQSLQQVKAQKHAIEQLREVNPEAYEAIKGIVQALIIMSQGMVGDMTEEPTPSSPPENTAKAELEKTNLKGFAPTSPGPVRRQSGQGPRRRLIAGSVKGGKKKIIDPVSGKTKWVTAARKRHPKMGGSKSTEPPKAPAPPKPKAG